MSLPEVYNPPAGPDIVTSPGDRQKAGVDWHYADAYNQAQMAKYNNEYNYWLWKQQVEYNSPSNQVARLKEAGLNPNFNSIEGTGNISSIPSSSGSISPSIGRNITQSTQNLISLAGAITTAFGQGVNAISTLSGVPPLSKVGEYRNLLFNLGKQNLKGKELQNYRSLIDSLVESYLAGGDISSMTIEDENGEYTKVNVPFGIRNPGTGETIVFDPLQMGARRMQEANLSLLDQRLKNLGADFDLKQLVKTAKSIQNERILPAQASVMEGKAGAAVIGKVINKVLTGEAITLNDFVGAILALLVQKW